MSFHRWVRPLSAAKRAEELTESKNSSVLDTLARVLFVKGNIDDAIAMEKKAIEIASPDEKEQYEASLKEFETAVAGGDKKEEKTPAADGQPSDTPDAGK